MKKTLYLMRHGQTLFNVRRKIQGACDSPLTEKGIKQAMNAKKKLEGIEFDQYYCSTAERASDTLEVIIGENTPYTRVKGLKEMNFGIYEGESEDLNPRWENGYDDVFPKSGGESTDDVSKRSKAACTEIMERDNHDTVLAIAHAGACFHFLRNWADPKPVHDAGGFSNCSILKFEYEDGKFDFIEAIIPDAVID